jgi:hypothetical protein
MQRDAPAEGTRCGYSDRPGNMGVKAMWCSRIALGLLATGLFALAAGTVLAINPNEIEVKPQQNPLDKDSIYDEKGNFRPDSKVWVLDFSFRAPRLIAVDVPGRGRKICWYMWYQVTNNTNEPHFFVPDFEVVTHDLPKNPVFRDQILPTVQDAISKFEDPTGYFKIKNSVTIAAEPIPANKKDATPYKVTGVAIWDDIDPNSNNFSVFVTGLSNGWSKDDNNVYRRKTLQLNFKKVGGPFDQTSREIQFVGPWTWIYRAVEKKEEKKDVEK